MTPTKAPLTWTNGPVTVTLTQLETGVWRVQTTAGGFVLDAWSHSYLDESAARSAARHVACAFDQWKTIRPSARCSHLRGVPARRRLPYVDELADATNFDEFNGPWAEIYDLADADRTWIATF